MRLADLDCYSGFLAGGAFTALIGWLGIMQRQVNGIAQDARRDADKTRDDTQEAIVAIQERVGKNERELTAVKEKMVTRDDLENAVCRIEKGVSDLGQDLRSEVRDTHKRVNQLYRNGHAGGGER